MALVRSWFTLQSHEKRDRSGRVVDAGRADGVRRVVGATASARHRRIRSAPATSAGASARCRSVCRRRTAGRADARRCAASRYTARATASRAAVVGAAVPSDAAKRRPFDGTRTARRGRSRAARGPVGLQLSDGAVGVHLRIRMGLGARRIGDHGRGGRAVHLPLHARVRMDLVHLTVGIRPVSLRRVGSSSFRAARMARPICGAPARRRAPRGTRAAPVTG
jgi:hypothetical protein